MSRSNHRSRSRSGFRRGTPFTSHFKLSSVGPADIVQLVNSTREGRMCLGAIAETLMRGWCFNSMGEAQACVWDIVNTNKGNFKVDEPMKSHRDLTGNELVFVKTSLALCETHCRRGKEGRNRDCKLNCGALHVCRTFLLLSADECPFNTRKKKCYFGHTFRTDHNLDLLEQNNLLTLNEEELQRLFRRRFSRSPTTMPNICKYYNKPEGNRCENKSCKSLHLCMSLVQGRCRGRCPRNHSLESRQVKDILFKIFAIDWPPGQVLRDLQECHSSRSRSDSNSEASGYDCEDSDDSEDFFSQDEAFEHKSPGSPQEYDRNGERWTVVGDSIQDKENCCNGCKELKAEMGRQLSDMMAQIQTLNKTVNDLGQKLESREKDQQTKNKLVF